MSPVTAETLRDTRDTARPPGDYAHAYYRVRDFVWGYSPAQRFTRELWFLAFFFVVAIIALEWAVNYLGLKKDAVAVAGWRFLWQSLVPWAYGALGACAFLLRSAHYLHPPAHASTRGARRNISTASCSARSRAAGSSCSPNTSPAPTTDRSRISARPRSASSPATAAISCSTWSSVSLPRYFPKSRPRRFRPTTPRRRLLRQIRRLSRRMTNLIRATAASGSNGDKPKTP